mgnify:FL=1
MKNSKKWMKNYYVNYYWLLSFLVIIAVALFSPGYGIIEGEFKKNMVFEELFYYNKLNYLQQINVYNSLSYVNVIFSKGFMYLALIFPSISCMMRYCDELNSGYSKLIITRIGNNKYIGRTVLRTLATAFIITFIALYVVYLIIYFRLPNVNEALERTGSLELLEGIGQIMDFKANGFLYVLRYIIPSSLFACVAGFLSILIATISHNKFLSLTIPILLIEAENSIFSGSSIAAIYKYKIRNFLYPFDDIDPWFTWWEFGLFILTLCVVLITVIYYVSGRRYREGE